ncbi:MAG: hypothetical protein ACI8TP_003652 [Acidimicrobiales bacterium]|jgi:hypothetical protein
MLLAKVGIPADTRIPSLAPSGVGGGILSVFRLLEPKPR